MSSIEAVGESDDTDAEPPIALMLDVVHESGDWGSLAGNKETAQAAASALAAEICRANSSACLALSSDIDVAALNATYRGKPAPTNVLSFPAGTKASEPGAQTQFLGDIVLAHETLAREAIERSLPLKDHMQHLVVHGLLHLLGYDHETEADAGTMEALETRVLARLGVADPYATNAGTEIQDLRKPATP
jgi:probable rRNA maturation factor